MRVKEIDRTANIAWSPAAQHPVYVAAGTAAQQLDATFSTSAALELYKLNLSDPGMDMELAGTIPSDCRFHKLVWGAHGMAESTNPAGVLVGGGDNGNVYMWDPDKLLQKEDCLIEKLEKHTGAIGALDFNTFQTNLLASGASDSEIYIWDLNNTANPMTPGAKSQPPDDVTCLAWNKTVQHILASTYAGRCVVWDLRKNEPIIKVSDSMSRIKCKLVAWHPDVATQMCLASEDDHTPVIQLWDLRFATSPLKSLESHQRGILSIAWCPQDPDLLLSCGKDNRILCWNPNSSVQTGEVVYELPTSHQWSFDVQWCPRNPAIISACSFDSHVSIYSLMGGGKLAQTSNKIADSFPADPFAQAPQQTTQDTPILPLKKPPKWLRRPVGASFGFGGKLITFENEKPPNPQQPVQRLVNVSQVVTETDLVARSNQLESALINNQLAEFCSMKISNSKDSMEESIWSFLKVHFEKEPRSSYLQLLGYDQNDLAKKVTETTGSEIKVDTGKSGVDANELAHKMEVLSATGSTLARDLTSSGQASPYIGDSQTPIENGNIGVDGTAAFDQIAAMDQDSRSDSPLPIAVSDEFEGLVTQALLMANFEAAVEVCLHNDRMAEAIILAIAGGPELLARTQKKFFRDSQSNLGRLISSVVTRDFEHIVRTCDLDNWKEALAVALTYAKADQFAPLCDILGSRLESEQHGELASSACLCYICAGNVDRLVECWAKVTKNTHSPNALQDLVEKVMLMRKAVEMAQGRPQEISSGMLAEKLSQYAELLAGQGSLQTAVGYLGNYQEMSLAILRDRLHQALGQGSPGGQQPFQKMEVLPEGAMQQMAQPQVAQAQAQAQVAAQRQRNISAGSGTGFQAVAGTFPTTTTSTSSYYSSQQYAGGFSNVSQPQAAPYSNLAYSTPTAVSSAAGPGTGQGPPSPKYPTYPQPTSTYNPYTSQPGYQAQPAYAASPAYGGASSYSSTQAQNVTSQPSIFNPAAGAAQNQTPGGPYVPPPASSAEPRLPSYQDMRPTGPWNDPPPLKESKKVTQNTVPTNYQPPAAITQPIYGVPQNEQTPPGAPNYGTQIYNPAQHQPQQPAPVPAQAAAAAPPAEPPKPVEKPPIPSEHVVLQEIFEKLANQCLVSATNPAMKRKMEDVLRKLEMMYNKLRDSALSASVVMGLHQIVQCIQQYDYQSGLAYHTQLISSGSFSEISSFMPGIKVLMQTAMQLQVYVQ